MNESIDTSQCLCEKKMRSYSVVPHTDSCVELGSMCANKHTHADMHVQCIVVKVYNMYIIT